jgi:hypothetical protein
MPNYVIRNQNFRDEVLKNPYPFDAFYQEEFDDLYVGNDVFLDAHFYFKTPVTLPVSLTIIDGTHGEEDEVKLTFTDDDNNTVGTCVFASGDERANVFNQHGVNVGILVLDAIGCGRFISSAQGRYYTIIPGDATLHVDTCKVSRQPNVRYVSDGRSAAFGALVRIVARHGVEWDRDGDVLSLNVLGEDPTLFDQAINPILSVNGVESKHIWLHTSPESNLRIATEGELKFQQAKDMTT